MYLFYCKIVIKGIFCISDAATRLQSPPPNARKTLVISRGVKSTLEKELYRAAITFGFWPSALVLKLINCVSFD